MLFEARQRRHAEIEPAKLLRSRPQHQFGEQIIHHDFWRSRRKSHQVDRHLFAIAAFPDCRERDDRTADAYDATVEIREVLRQERTQRKTLFVDLFVLQPRIGYHSEFIEYGRYVARRNDFETRAFAVRTIACMAQFGAVAALDAEVGQTHTRDFAKLCKRKTKIYVEPQFRVRHLVEHTSGVMLVGFFAKEPREFLVTLRISDRAGKRDPATAGNLEHDESVAFGMKQESFVAEQCNVGNGT